MIDRPDHHRARTVWAVAGRRRAALSAAACVALTTGVLCAPGVAADGRSSTQARPAADPQVIADWNATMVDTIVTDAAKGPAEAGIYFAFTQLAVYNAVVGITGDFKTYRWHNRGPSGASPEAAAAAAGHELLLTYFPGSRDRLDSALSASLAKVPDGWAEERGVAFGKRAAEHIVDLRADDGRNSPLEFTKPIAPGVWRPTADPPVPFFAPWLSELKPFVMRTPEQFRPGPPPRLTSARYAREFKEVKRLGSATSAARTPSQTQTALFFSDTGVGGLQAAVRDLAIRYRMSISESAHLLAAVDVSVGDAVISTWDAKFHYGFWRPITAIQLANTDGNPATHRDRGWTSLLAAPPYPDYTSGLNAFVGATSRAVARVLHSDRIDLYITSPAAGETRHYARAGSLNHDAIDARVWSGLHFRTADVVGNHRAQRVARFVTSHAFQPVRCHDR